MYSVQKSKLFPSQNTKKTRLPCKNSSSSLSLFWWLNQIACFCRCCSNDITKLGFTPIDEENTVQKVNGVVFQIPHKESTFQVTRQSTLPLCLAHYGELCVCIPLKINRMWLCFIFPATRHFIMNTVITYVLTLTKYLEHYQAQVKGSYPLFIWLCVHTAKSTCKSAFLPKYPAPINYRFNAMNKTGMTRSYQHTAWLHFLRERIWSY